MPASPLEAQEVKPAPSGPEAPPRDHALASAYHRLVLTRPKAVLAALLALLAFFAYHAKDFRLDASADSLLLEDDPDLHVFRQLSARYHTQDLLLVTFTPTADLFSDEALSHLGRLRDELRAVNSVESIATILDVPLVKSSDVSLAQMAANVQTLETPGIDRQRAREELTESPVYQDLVVSRDGQTTAILLNLTVDQELRALLDRRNELRMRRSEAELTPDERGELERVSAAYEEGRVRVDAQTHRDIAKIRSVIDAYRPHGELYLGGVPMIADDMITFVKSDLFVFGSGVLVFLVIILGVIFRQLHWVLLPLASCFYAGLTMVGMLGLIGWEVTVISSNFLALMLIITISMNIHLAVRYRQLLRQKPDESHLSLVATTLRRMVWPCLYTALTTIMGFGSLAFSNIKPVQDFGWMMSVGLAVAFLTSFSLFPALLVLLGKPRNGGAQGRESRLPMRLATLTERHGNAILVIALVLAIVSGVGISRLTVENSFIDYFSKETEIYQGMQLIDAKLGGTTPLQVLLHFDTGVFEDEVDVAAGPEDDEEEFEDFEDWDIDVASGPEYWFTDLKIERIKKVHDYLDGLPEVGKVLSLTSLIRVAEERNDGKEFNSFELGVLYKKLPPQLRERMVDPYFDLQQNEARIQLRILDSQKDLRRAELLERIQNDFRDRLELDEQDVTIAGTLLLYNNVLQSLYGSQIASFGAVLVGVAIMFLILFRSVSLSIIGIVPNVLAAAIVLGLMGWLGIPLDIMTITISAIAIGIAVDNAIHYIYRYREEFAQSGDYAQTLRVSHSSIGRAVLYTCTTLIFGFSILVLSNFLPTIYFGALTGLAIFIAMLAALTLLPRLIVLWRPFG
jgi:predicted RND superfamily exporter protein